MKNIIFIFALIFSVLSHAEKKQDDPLKFDLRRITISAAAELYYSLQKKPFIISDDVLNDSRAVTFRTGDLEGSSFFDTMLKTYGFERLDKNGIELVRKEINDDPDSYTTIIIKPQFRTASYLTGLLQPLLKGKFSTTRQVSSDTPSQSKDVPVSSVAAMTEQTSDILIFSGHKKEVDLINKLISQIDVPEGQVLIRSAIFETTDSMTRANAFQLLGALFNGRFSMAAGVPSVGDSLSLSTGNFSAVISALNSDSRFQVLSTPEMRLTSGQSGKFTVGQSTPTLGSTTTSGVGQVTQSVVYHDSGLILDVTPIVRGGDVNLKIMQELSSFAQTTTGIADSPTLTKRSIQSTLNLTDSEIVVLGSLGSSNNSDTSQGYPFMPDFLNAKNKTKAQSQVLLLIQVQKII